MAPYAAQKPLAFLLLLGIAIFGALSSATTGNFDRRLGDLQRVGNALAAYKQQHGRYPLQGEKNLVIGLDPAASEFSKLVPSLLAQLPRDPRLLADPNRQYLYFSNGTDFKFITHGPEDMGFVQKKMPTLVDPRRPQHAYGIWTAGAVTW